MKHFLLGDVLYVVQYGVMCQDAYKYTVDEILSTDWQSIIHVHAGLVHVHVPMYHNGYIYNVQDI